jgi:hypothetical protein
MVEHLNKTKKLLMVRNSPLNHCKEVARWIEASSNAASLRAAGTREEKKTSARQNKRQTKN